MVHQQHFLALLIAFDFIAPDHLEHSAIDDALQLAACPVLTFRLPDLAAADLLLIRDAQSDAGVLLRRLFGKEKRRVFA